MKSVAAAMLGSLVLFLTGCNQYIERSKYEESQAELAKTKKQLEEAQTKIADGQKKIDELSAHKFSTYANGLRTWRFDSVTGEACILLTTSEDWKTKKTKQQSCNCVDTRADYFKELSAIQDGESRKLIIENWKLLLNEACGA